MKFSKFFRVDNHSGCLLLLKKKCDISPVIYQNIKFSHSGFPLHCHNHKPLCLCACSEPCSGCVGWCTRLVLKYPYYAILKVLNLGLEVCYNRFTSKKHWFSLDIHCSINYFLTGQTCHSGLANFQWLLLCLLDSQECLVFHL